MKKIQSYLMSLAVGAALSLGAASCDENFERPPMVIPTTDMEANTTIAAFKTMYWQNERNYVATPGTIEDGRHMIIGGRVVSSAVSGNIYNNIVIQDETAAITIAVVSKDLTSSPLYGQMLYVDVTGLKVGGYNSLMQLGAEGTYNGAPSMTFMQAATLEEHWGIGGLPEAARCDTLVMEASALPAMVGNQSDLITYQSRLVRFNGMSFEKPGQPFNDSSSTVDCYARDEQGNRLLLRISNYADFARAIIPEGRGSLTGILSYFGTTWQLLLIDAAGVAGFDTEVVVPTGPGEPEEPDTPGTPGADEGQGTKESPFTVAQVMGGASGSDVWTKGVIVGYVPGMVLDEAVLGAPATVASNILIAASADVKNAADCVPVQLPAGNVRNKLNLMDNPGNLGAEVILRGSMEKYFGTNGIKSVTEFVLEGAEEPEPDTPMEALSSLDENFDASTNIPAGWTQVQVAGNKSWYVPTFNENNYAAMTGYKGTAPFDQWLITPPLKLEADAAHTLNFDTEVNGYGSTTSALEVYVLENSNDPAGAKLTKLAPKLATAPASGYSSWEASGSLDLSAFTGEFYIGFRYVATQDANYATWCVDNVVVK